MKILSILNAKTLISIALLTAICSSVIFAAAGDLDLTFDGAGYSDSALPGGTEYATDSALQNDGKIILVGDTSNVFSAVRYNANGTLDTTFGRRGLARIDFGDGTIDTPKFMTSSFARAVAIQSDGKILVAGAVHYRTAAFGSFESDLVLVRLNSDGFLDRTFNGDGKIRTRILSRSSVATAMAVAGDGKIIVAGSAGSFGILRFHPDGSPDQSFGEDGVLRIATLGEPRDLIVQPDGKIIAVGSQPGPTSFTSDFAIVRLNVDGSFDTEFNDTGIAPTPPFVGRHDAHSVALQDDGKIVVSGSWDQGQAALLRYQPNGEFDNSFGSAGLLISYFPAVSFPDTRLLIQPDGKIVVASTFEFYVTGTVTEIDISVQRFNQNGSVDGSFNTTGSRRISMGDGDESIAGILLQPDNKILVTGYRSDGGRDFVMARLISDGAMDTSFGTDGKVVSDVGYGGGIPNDVTVQGDGKIVVVGAQALFAVVRYKVDGTLDTSFNNIGRVRMFSDGSSATSVVSQPDGKLLIAGRLKAASNVPTDSLIVRLNGDGSPDPAFGSEGTVVTSVGTYNDEFKTLALQPDGKIVAGGYTARDTGGAASDLSLVRYRADGAFDTAFGRRGKVVGLAECGTSDSFISAVALQGDGKILAAGFCGGFAIMRFNSNGSLDNTFNNTGVKVISGALFATHAADLKIQADGRIVVTGGFHDFVVVRLDSNGDLDPSFNGNGIVTHSLGELPEGARSLEIQADGKLVVSGNYQAHSLRYSSAVLRFNSDGSIDNTWGTAGVMKLPFTGNVFTSGTALDSDGKVLVSAQLNGLFGIVRLVGDSATASFASVSGQVRDLSGQPVPRAVVLMTDSSGNTRTAQANPFGYYNFDNVRTGESYNFTAMAKRYRFTPRTVVVGGDLTGVDIISNQ